MTSRPNGVWKLATSCPRAIGSFGSHVQCKKFSTGIVLQSEKKPAGGVFAGIMAAGMAARTSRVPGVKPAASLDQALLGRQSVQKNRTGEKSQRANGSESGAGAGAGAGAGSGRNGGVRGGSKPGQMQNQKPKTRSQNQRGGQYNSQNMNQARGPGQNQDQNHRQSQNQARNQAQSQAQVRSQSQAQSHARAQTQAQAQIQAQTQARSNNRGNSQPPVAPKPMVAKPPPPKKVKEVSFKKPVIALPKFVTVTNFADILKLRFTDLQKRMKALGFEDVNHDFIIDEETAHLIADELGYEVVINEIQGADLFAAPLPEDMSGVPLRPPIVTIMGHVDHGKTTVLDYLRKSSVAASEHGGITQHIGAFSVKMVNTKREICFLDTPGHAAFLNMRQRGANITDIVILIVAADDSVMPQTKEAIKHAKAANVPVIVAINKIDRPDADAEKVLSDLAANGVEIEDYGGDTQTVRVSGKTGQGIDKLEEAILTLSEVLDIRSPPDGKVEGWIIESQMKKGLGSVATVLVRRGTLKPGSVIVAGTKYCKVRMIKNDQGKVVKSAGPGTPVEVLGWKELPEAGDEVLEAESEQLAKQVVENRIARADQIKESQDILAINEKRRQMHLNQLKEQEREERLKLGLPLEEKMAEQDAEAAEKGSEKINFIIKADVSGSAEAVKDSIEGLGNEDIQASVLYSGVGDVTESDVTRAQTSNAVILTFNVKAPREVMAAASKAKVELMSHTIIYRLLEEVSTMLGSKLKPDIKHKVLGEASIREVFSISTKKSKPLLIAGCKVTNGILTRKSPVKVLRNGKVVYTGAFTSMKHHKDEVKEAKKDSECGISFENWDDFKEGDSIQTFEEIIVPRHL
ncbi:translation initiation factor 2 [Sugiyamaella lignohabitans]|uniref:Translation initiation factor IF-2, mitochondrial n=1 Tax=Sugiyamaella lignohabitans TaxID=796027 RepID=A0A167FBX8_9ASCO|nr:translation initiation factor 2 [Sugiyamaella lignohabitans]ANB15091.1 translation initiation factor 2 [Sugiyamaella lignohabitans]